jgi:hypothetical protein
MRCQIVAMATLESASIIASMWPFRPFRAAGSRWIFFRSGGSADASALMIVRGEAALWPFAAEQVRRELTA